MVEVALKRICCYRLQECGLTVVIRHQERSEFLTLFLSSEVEYKRMRCQNAIKTSHTIFFLFIFNKTTA